jgi:hypothetical protein
LDAADPDHDACAALLTEAAEDLVVPTLVLGELEYWCAERLDPAVWLAFLDDVLASAYRVEPPTGADRALPRHPGAERGPLRRRRGRPCTWTRCGWCHEQGVGSFSTAYEP